MNLGQILKSYRESHSLSLQKFAEKAGLSKGYLHMLEIGKNSSTGKAITPNVQTINKLAKAMEIDTQKLINLIETINNDYWNEKEIEKLFNDATNSKINQYRSQPFIIYNASDITSDDSFNKKDIKDTSLDVDIVNFEIAKKAGEIYGLKVFDDSNYPYLLKDDVVIFSKQLSCDNNDLAIFLLDNKLSIRKVIESDNNLILQALNPDYIPRVVKRTDVRNGSVKIIGKVIQIKRTLV